MSSEPVIENLGRGALPRRRRNFYPISPQPLSTLPADWRELLERWVRRGGNSRWETLLKDAGVVRQQIAHSLLDWLLRHGWAAVEEERKLGDWWPLRLELRALPELKQALGLPDAADLAARRDALLAQLEAHGDPALEPVLAVLEAMPAQRALERAALVLALLGWREQERSGTRRDFALFARTDTKDITGAEWRWLDEQLDLLSFGVERHTPLLYISAAVTLALPGGVLNIGALPDFAALTPTTVSTMQGIQGRVDVWQLVENRTSFERVARRREPGVGAIWLPGYPPQWWRVAVSRILTLVPAPALIACDPDPAGIAIFLAAAEVWQEAGLMAEPWKMSVDDLKALPKRKPLSEHDRGHLQDLMQGALPGDLRALAAAMLVTGEKGEQEGCL